MGWSVNRSTGLTWNRPELTTKGYTLITPSSDNAAYLIDMDGQVVHRWTFDTINPGDGRLLDNGERAEWNVAVGDRVLFTSYGGTEVKYNGQEYLIMEERDILGVIN